MLSLYVPDRRRGTQLHPCGTRWRCYHSLVPMSCELPQMKGRNWKSSRPHTPWLPAGSILYVFCNFRITSRYLCWRGGEKGETKVRNGILQHTKSMGNEPERANGLSFPLRCLLSGRRTKHHLETRLSIINPGNL